MLVVRITTYAAAVTTALATACSPAAAQSATVPDSSPNWSTGSLRVEFGSDRLGVTDLNRTMAANGRPEFGTTLGTIGLSGYARYGRALVGGTGETALPQRNVESGWINKLWYGAATGDLGVVAVETSRFIVYPQVSLGVRHRVLQLEQAGDFSYDDGVAGPARSVRMSTWRALAGYGVVAEWRTNSRLTGPISLGARAGYSTPMGGGHTVSGESTVNRVPGEGAGGYVRFAIGKPIGRRGSAASVLSSVLVPLVAR
jgi:hypothetical protein